MTAQSRVKTERLPKYVRTKRAKGKLYYYFEMERPDEGKPTFRRLPHISMPHFHAECRAALQERLGLREPDRTPQSQFHVYFVAGEFGPIKIGLARRPEQRIRELQVGSPIRLSILATAKGGRRLELAYHDKFAAYRLHGEWFERCPDLEAEIEMLNAPQVQPQGGDA